MYSLDHRQVLHIPLDDLVVHQKLIEIYGENENRPKLEASIRRKGIITPLEVSTRTGVKVVLSGKCRLQIARKLGFADVPVTLGNYSCEEEELDVLFALNLQREGKTNSQKLVEGKYWESIFKPQAKERQRENARRLNEQLRDDSTKYSNLNTSLNETNSQESEKFSVLQEVTNRVKLSVGSYHKGKKVFEYISQLKQADKLQAAIALEQELNRSIDAAYKFICDERRNEVINVIERGEVNTIRDALGLVRRGFRNPFRGFEVGQVYQFKKHLRPSLEICGRVIKITDELVEFGFRNLETKQLDTACLRPYQVEADLVEEPSMQERTRIFRLLQNPDLIYPVRVVLAEMLKFPHLTMEEEVFLKLLESGKFEEMVEQRKTELEMLAKNENAGDSRAA
ncbi:hypothetical protein CEN40_01900 [Fischerella thermalis CCMEE 5205]|nr:hypothetical protein CEN40_01900 [Fischerella thermalis CCMEE 5205]